MIIELIGLPGCGKTTYATMLKKKNSKYSLPLNKYIYSKYRIIRNIKKLRLLILFIFKNITIFNNIIQKFNKIQFKSSFLKYKMFVYLISTLQVINICRKKEGTYILDEGICQVFWGILFNTTKDKAEIFKLFTMLKHFIGNEIIELKPSVHIIKKRLRNRCDKGGDELKVEILKDTDIIYESEEYIIQIKEFLNNNNINVKEIGEVD